MNFDWSFFWENLFSPTTAYRAAFLRTLSMAIIAQLIGILIGSIVAAGRMSRVKVLNILSYAYTWVIRGIPVIVLMVIFFTGFAAAGFYRFQDISFFGLVLAANLQAAILALGIREGAYMGEIIRNGLEAVGSGQIQAAEALGMPRMLRLRRIIIPQAMRVIIPPLGNSFNIMLKTTSLAQVIGVKELFLTTRTISSMTFRVFEMFIVLALNYLVLTTVWAIIQALIESKLRKHEAEEEGLTLWQRLSGHLVGGTQDEG